MTTPELDLRIDRHPADFSPGEELIGRASWRGITKIRRAELRLYWTTSGSGTADTEIVEAIPFENPGPDDSRDFRIRLPDGPTAFEGALVSLQWGVELVITPGRATHTLITLAPGRRPATLTPLPDQPKRPWHHFERTQ